VEYLAGTLWFRKDWDTSQDGDKMGISTHGIPYWDGTMKSIRLDPPYQWELRVSKGKLVGGVLVHLTPSSLVYSTFFLEKLPALYYRRMSQSSRLTSCIRA